MKNQLDSLTLTPTPSGLLPRIAHRDYFESTGEFNIDVEPERFGFVTPIGQDVYSFLCCANSQFIRNIHQEQLDDWGLSLSGAQAKALENLRHFAFDGETIQQNVTRTPSGKDWSVWLGNDFTASCILLPELFAWSQQQLKVESLLVCVPCTQLLFIVPDSYGPSVTDFDRYIENVVGDDAKLISSEWFQLTAVGLRPWLRA